MDSSAPPSIHHLLRSWVWILCTPSTLFHDLFDFYWKISMSIRCESEHYMDMKWNLAEVGENKKKPQISEIIAKLNRANLLIHSLSLSLSLSLSHTHTLQSESFGIYLINFQLIGECHYILCTLKAGVAVKNKFQSWVSMLHSLVR